ncbi:MAG TPA: outer membrane protein assembly factor BamD [Flavipsychrobacter sp.]|nr:outer membrane protein assembly factor BamD [Flavipsychrobacter sp.]
MPFRTRHLLLVCLSIVLLSACGDYQKILKSSDVNYKLTKANEYYNNKDYQRANELYESLLPVMKNTKNYAPLYYRYAYSFYYIHDYLAASYHFKNFVEFFPNSPDADECEFMHGVSLYKYAPKYSLDQTNTIKALEALQSYVNTHPTSKHLAEANGYIAESNKKLEEKAASAAKLYYNIGQYKAAGVAYKSVMRDYPDSPSSDFYEYMIVRSLYNYAKQSVATKQEERFANTISAYHELADSYPKSQYLDDAQKITVQADNYIKKIRNEQHQ